MTRFDIALVILSHPFLFGLGALASINLAFALGRHLGRAVPDPDENNSFGLMDGAIFALLGLLFAFSFSNAAARFDHRRSLIVEEANAISTARLRIDLVPSDARRPLLDSFERYVESRVASYAKAADPAGFAEAFARTEALQAEVWTQAISAGRRPDALPAVNQQLIPALNTMFDIALTRAMAMATRAPEIVMISLWIAALVASAVAGVSSRASNHVRWVSVTGYAAMISLSIYLIVDFEYPRAGLIRVDDLDAVIQRELKRGSSN